MESQNCSRDSRELWLDLAKAIGIIMVLIAHALPKDSYLWSWINSFHMPLFFSISGYLYVCKKTFLNYLIRKIKTLYIPFLVASLIMYLVFIIINKTQFTIKGILKIVLTITSGPLLGATWFIPV